MNREKRVLVSVRIPTQDRVRAQKLAQNQGETFSSLVRRALKRELAAFNQEEAALNIETG